MRDRLVPFALLLLGTMMTGCAAPAERRSSPGTSHRIEPWEYDGAPGHVVLTNHYAIHTTIDDPQIQDNLAAVMEGALVEYQRFTPGLRLSVNPMQCYIFARRNEWAEFTRDRTGEDAAVYLQINRGGYTIRDWYVAYLISESGTYAVAAHEGWHQYVARNFKSRLPPFLEEGIATMFETIVWDNGGRPRWVLSVNPLRAAKLQHAIESQHLWALDKLVTMHAGDVVGLSGERIETFYAQNWAFAMFLWESDHGRYRPAMQRMLLDLATGNVPASTGVRRGGGENWNPATARPLLEHYLGLNLRQIEREYLEYVHRIASSARYQPRTSGEHRSETIERRTVHFSGRVQGVGFRYTAQALARNYPVTGYVVNLDDGRVEVVVEGAPSEIDQLIEAIRERMTGLVRAVESHISAATGEFTGFTIRQ